MEQMAMATTVEPHWMTIGNPMALSQLPGHEIVEVPLVSTYSNAYLETITEEDSDFEPSDSGSMDPMFMNDHQMGEVMIGELEEQLDYPLIDRGVIGITQSSEYMKLHDISFPGQAIQNCVVRTSTNGKHTWSPIDSHEKAGGNGNEITRAQAVSQGSITELRQQFHDLSRTIQKAREAYVHSYADTDLDSSWPDLDGSEDMLVLTTEGESNRYVWTLESGRPMEKYNGKDTSFPQFDTPLTTATTEFMHNSSLETRGGFSPREQSILPPPYGQPYVRQQLTEVDYRGRQYGGGRNNSREVFSSVDESKSPNGMPGNLSESNGTWTTTTPTMMRARINDLIEHENTQSQMKRISSPISKMNNQREREDPGSYYVNLNHPFEWERGQTSIPLRSLQTRDQITRNVSMGEISPSNPSEPIIHPNFSVNPEPYQSANGSHHPGQWHYSSPFQNRAHLEPVSSQSLINSIRHGFTDPSITLNSESVDTFRGPISSNYHPQSMYNSTVSTPSAPSNTSKIPTRNSYGMKDYKNATSFNSNSKTIENSSVIAPNPIWVANSTPLSQLSSVSEDTSSRLVEKSTPGLEPNPSEYQSSFRPIRRSPAVVGVSELLTKTDEELQRFMQPPPEFRDGGRIDAETRQNFEGSSRVPSAGQVDDPSPPRRRFHALPNSTEWNTQFIESTGSIGCGTDDEMERRSFYDYGCEDDEDDLDELENFDQLNPDGSSSIRLPPSLPTPPYPHNPFQQELGSRGQSKLDPSKWIVNGLLDPSAFNQTCFVWTDNCERIPSPEHTLPDRSKSPVGPECFNLVDLPFIDSEAWNMHPSKEPYFCDPIQANLDEITLTSKHSSRRTSWCSLVDPNYLDSELSKNWPKQTNFRTKAHNSIKRRLSNVLPTTRSRRDSRSLEISPQYVKRDANCRRHSRTPPWLRQLCGCVRVTQSH